jgi:putative NIF3 family GTP cyclohydrolase 1 type 2
MANWSEEQIAQIVKSVLTQVKPAAEALPAYDATQYNGRKFIGVFEDMTDAIEAAMQGYKAIRATSVADREKLVTKIRDMVREEASVMAAMGVDETGAQWGLLRKGTVEEQPLEAFLPRVKSALGCEGLRYVDTGKPVRKVAVGGGSCADEMHAAIAAGCDTFVTADVKYNQFWDAKDLGLNLIDAGHFYTENPVTAYLAAQIAAAFPDVTVKISETHRDCMKFY